MATVFPAFSHPYKHFQRLEATNNGFFAVRDADDSSKNTDDEVTIDFVLSGTAVEGVDYDIIEDQPNWSTAPAVTTHILTWPAATTAIALWIRVLDPVRVTRPLSIVIELTNIIGGNAQLRAGDRKVAVAYIEPSVNWQKSDWLDPFGAPYLGNLDSLGQGPTVISTDLGLFPNWGRNEVELTLDIPVSAVASDDRTEQRLSTYAYDSILIDEGDPEESLQHKGDLDMQMSVTYTATKDRNFDAYHRLAAAQMAGFAWVPFYPQPLYPYLGKGYDPIDSANSRTIQFENLHASVRRLLVMGNKIIRVNAADTSQFEVRTVQNTPEEIWAKDTHGSVFVDSPLTLVIPDRESSELLFTMLPMVMVGPLQRPSDTDDVHHMAVNWQLLGL